MALSVLQLSYFHCSFAIFGICCFPDLTTLKINFVTRKHFSSCKSSSDSHILESSDLSLIHLSEKLHSLRKSILFLTQTRNSHMNLLIRSLVFAKNTKTSTKIHGAIGPNREWAHDGKLFLPKLASIWQLTTGIYLTF